MATVKPSLSYSLEAWSSLGTYIPKHALSKIVKSDFFQCYGTGSLASYKQSSKVSFL